MDGAWLRVIDVAIKKARASALFEMETQTLDNYRRAGAGAHGIVDPFEFHASEKFPSPAVFSGAGSKALLSDLPQLHLSRTG